jgi:hypothetical protein
MPLSSVRAAIGARAVVLAPGLRVVELVEGLNAGGEVEYRIDILRGGGDRDGVEQVELGAPRRVKLVAGLEREWLERPAEDAAAAGREWPHGP